MVRMVASGPGCERQREYNEEMLKGIGGSLEVNAQESGAEDVQAMKLKLGQLLKNRCGGQPEQENKRKTTEPKRDTQLQSLKKDMNPTSSLKGECSKAQEDFSKTRTSMRGGVRRSGSRVQFFHFS